MEVENNNLLLFIKRYNLSENLINDFHRHGFSLITQLQEEFEYHTINIYTFLENLNKNDKDKFLESMFKFRYNIATKLPEILENYKLKNLTDIYPEPLDKKTIQIIEEKLVKMILEEMNQNSTIVI